MKTKCLIGKSHLPKTHGKDSSSSYLGEESPKHARPLFLWLTRSHFEQEYFEAMTKNPFFQLVNLGQNKPSLLRPIKVNGKVSIKKTQLEYCALVEGQYPTTFGGSHWNKMVTSC